MKTVKGFFKNLINTVIVGIMVAISFSVMAFCWFADTGNSFVMNFNSSTASAYFAGGNGSKEEPYLISSPVHMYNFAWLQYLGYFNLKDGFNNGRAQSFFELTDNINMSSIAIPPIGTREYPFIGYFDGNGKTVYNLTVSNNKSDLIRKPSNVNFTAGNENLLANAGDRSAAVDIVGLFGVTGDFNSFITGSKYKDKSVIVDGKETKVDIKKTKSTGTGTATGTGAATGGTGGTSSGNGYISLPSKGTDVAANEIYYSGMGVNNLYVDKISVKSIAPNTLVGLAAGYVSSTVQDVGVYRSKVTLSGAASGAKGVNSASSAVDYGSTISRYTIVGDYDDGLVGWEEVPVEGSGDDNAWGGSIDMKMINRRLGYMIAESAIDKDRNASSSSYNVAIKFNTVEYYWKQISSTTNIAYFNEGTVLPLNIDKNAMYLNGEEGTVKDSSGNTVKDENGNNLYYEKTKNVTIGSNAYTLHTNSYYENNTTEKVAKSNTGYLVGIGTSGPRARIQEAGITNSVNGNSTFDANNFTMLTVGTNGKTYIIDDGKNKLKSSELAAIDQKRSSKEFEHYDTVYENFIDTMTYTDSDGNKVGEKYVHGFHFLNSINTGSPSITNFSNAQILGKTYANYQFLSGGLNFSANEGSLRVIVGSYYRNGSQSLFDLFKVDRDADGNILYSDGKPQITKIETIYKNGDNISYNTNSVGGYLAFDFAAINAVSTSGSSNAGGALKTYKAAYYFEIPVTAGDYVIGCDVDTSIGSSSSADTAYLMYLDIGANGDGGSETETRPYNIQAVDFVAAASSDTGDFVTVPESGYPSYKDVGFKLGAGTDVIHFKRKSYDSLPAAGGTVETPVYYWSELSAITISAFPSELASEDPKREPYWTIQ